MPELNKVLIAGRPTDDPQIKYTPDGTGVATFSLAVNHYARDKQESSVSYFEVVASGKVAEFIRDHIKKGSQIFIDGRLRQVKYSVKVDGEEKTRSKVEIVAHSIFPINLHTGRSAEDDSTIEY